MIYNFDRSLDRRQTDSIKWRLYDEDILPLWVADMDFVSPEPVIDALHQRINHGVFGYPEISPELSRVVVDRMANLYDWHIKPQDVIFLPGVVTGFNIACHMYSAEGGAVLIQTPVYPPFIPAPINASLERQEMQLSLKEDETYYIDFTSFKKALSKKTRLFILCNPHNPVGRVFKQEELETMAEICLQQGVVICSDEIHCDLVFSGQKHVPIASLHPEIGQNTITLMAPSKTYNIAGLECSVAIIQNPKLRQQYEAARSGLVGWVNILGLTAALAAYKYGQEWLDQVMNYLEANRDYLYDYVTSELPGVKMTKPEGTYLAWLDCRNSKIEGNPYKFFLENARVALNDGVSFGQGGEGFVRLNFGCPRATLSEALNRMKRALISISN